MDKKIIKNYVLNMLREVFVVLLPLAVVPYVSRIMSAEEIGVYNYSLNVVSYFTIAAELGFQFLGKKEIAKVSTKAERSDVFLKIFLIRIIFGCIINTIYFAVVPNIVGSKDVYILQGINLIAIPFEISWYYIGVEDFKRITARSIFYKIFNLILIFFCVRGENILLKYIVCMGLPNVFGNLLMFYKLDISWKIPKITLAEIKKYMIAAVVLLIPSLLKSLYTIIDKTILGRLSTMEEVGYYAQTFKLLNVLIAIVYSIGTVSFARLVMSYHQENYNNVRKLMKEIVTFVLHIGFPIIMGLFCVSDVFVSWFYGEKYFVLNTLLPIASPLLILTALNNVLCSQYLIAINREKVLIKITLIGVIVNLIFDLFLIPELGAEGAIIASMISEGTVLGVSGTYYRKTMKGTLLELENLKCIMSSFAMMFVLMYIKKFLIINDIGLTFILIGIGIIVYFLMEILLRDLWCISLLQKIVHVMKKKFQSNSI